MADKEDAEKERRDVTYQMEKESNSKVVLEEFLIEVKRDRGNKIDLDPALISPLSPRGSTHITPLQQAL